MDNRGTPNPEHAHSFALAVLNAQAGRIEGHPRFMPIEGDSMEPTLTFRHLAAVVPVAKFCGEGLYALNVYRDQVDFFRCNSIGPGGVMLSRDNPRYGSYSLSWPDFETALLGKVAGIMQVIEPTLLGRGWP